MRVVSPVLKRVLYPCLGKSGYFRRTAGPGPAILTYHGVLPAGYQSLDPDFDGALVNAASIRRQLRLLKSRYHVITPEEFRAWCTAGEVLPQRAVLLTCDDALENAVTDMLPVLQEFDVRCLFFVVSACLEGPRRLLWHDELYLYLLHTRAPEFEVPGLGVVFRARDRQQKRRLWWDLVKRLSAYDAHRRGIFLEQIRAQLSIEDVESVFLKDDPTRRRLLMLDGTGLRKLLGADMSIGAHTHSHCMLSKANDGLAWDEIASSRRALAAVLNQPIWALAYPFGNAEAVTARELSMAERAGYDCAFLNSGGGFGADLTCFALPRVHVTGSMTPSEFEAHLSGFYQQTRRRFLSALSAVPGAAAEGTPAS